MATRYYEALGLKRLEEGNDAHINLSNDNCLIALMKFLGAIWLNFRGGDVFALYDILKSTGLDLEGKPKRYSAEEYGTETGGAHWKTKDPDGNVVYFDTVDTELIKPGDPAVIKAVLLRASKRLGNIKATSDCQSVFTNFLSKWGA